MVLPDVPHFLRVLVQMIGFGAANGFLFAGLCLFWGHDAFISPVLPAFG